MEPNLGNALRNKRTESNKAYLVIGVKASVVQEMGKDLVSGCPKDRKALVQNRWMQLQQFSPTIPAKAYRPIKINDRL